MAANVRFSNPKTMAKPPGYTYVVEATGPNRLIFIAGQLGLDMDNQLVGGPGDFRAQAFKAFQNLKLALEAAGAGFKDVVKINSYLTDMSHIGTFREVRDDSSIPPRRRRDDRRHFATGAAGRAVRGRGDRGAAGESGETCRRQTRQGQGAPTEMKVSRPSTGSSTANDHSM